MDLAIYDNPPVSSVLKLSPNPQQLVVMEDEPGECSPLVPALMCLVRHGHIEDLVAELLSCYLDSPNWRIPSAMSQGLM